MIKEKIEEIFNVLQDLDMKPTPHNVSIIGGVFDSLRAIYAEIEKEERNDEDGRAANSSE